MSKERNALEFLFRYSPRILATNLDAQLFLQPQLLPTDLKSFFSLDPYLTKDRVFFSYKNQ